MSNAFQGKEGTTTIVVLVLSVQKKAALIATVFLASIKAEERVHI